MIERVTVSLCSACIDGVGKECHTPGCALYLHAVDLPIPRDLLTDASDVSRVEAENELLRQMLWLSHGCPHSALYGDDGEMQCGRCSIDFKRASAESIRDRRLDLAAKAANIAALADLVSRKTE